jgi:hypothetical protein
MSRDATCEWIKSNIDKNKQSHNKGFVFYKIKRAFALTFYSVPIERRVFPIGDEIGCDFFLFQ